MGRRGNGITKINKEEKNVKDQSTVEKNKIIFGKSQRNDKIKSTAEETQVQELDNFPGKTNYKAKKRDTWGAKWKEDSGGRKREDQRGSGGGRDKKTGRGRGERRKRRAGKSVWRAAGGGGGGGGGRGRNC